MRAGPTIALPVAALWLVLVVSGCSRDADTPAGSDRDQPPGTAQTQDTTDAGASPAPLPVSFAGLNQPWSGDLDGMVERGLIRVAVPLVEPLFFYEQGRPRGILADYVGEFERELNRSLGRKHVRVLAVPIPMSRKRFIPDLTAGRVDLVAADLTVTVGRRAFVDFSVPVLRDVREVLITGPSAPAVDSLLNLAGQTVYVRRSSSYYEHLAALNASLTSQDLDPVRIREAEELLEADDLTAMVAAGIIPMTIVDDYRARWTAQAYPSANVREDIVINEGGVLAWAMRKDSPQLKAKVDSFLRKKRQGTLFGNVLLEKYLVNRAPMRSATDQSDMETLAGLADVFRRYADRYGHDWLMLAAQAYQESGLRHDRVSPAGAVGIMQIRPSTAADPNVGIPDISSIEANIHAGAKYMRFLEDRYFDDDGIGELDRWLFGLAAYNAGPARIRRLRAEAARQGYDRNVWFQNVEIIAARDIGYETVTYVSNVFRYYIGYRIVLERDRERQRLLEGLRTGAEGV